MKAVLVEHTGGPEAMRYADLPKPEPGAGQLLVKVAAAGVNFIDVYHRSGLYKQSLPLVLGLEGAGTVEALGPGVAEFKAGDRVAWSTAPGSYAQYVAVPAAQAVAIPDGLGFDQAAGSMLQGMTAHYLTHSTFPLGPGHTALVHAAAGGAGLMVVQMAKLRGARVIGTVSTEAKAELARSAGADHVIVYTEQDFAAEVRRLTGGQGLDVVYDSVGATTWQGSLDCLRKRGMLVLWGNSSGPVPPIDPLVLSQKGSLFLTRPTLFHHLADRQELLWRSGDVLGWLDGGKLKLHIGGRYPLAAAAQAHEDLESRATAGKLVLLVD